MRPHTGVSLARGAALFAALFTLLASAADPLPAYHLTLLNENGETIGEYVSAADHEATPPAVLGLLETEEGFRAELRYSLDRDEGIVTYRLSDLHSGWWLQLTHEFGVRNLGNPEDYADPMEWLVAMQERQKRERPTSRYTLSTSDGGHSEWAKPWQMAPEQAEAVQTEALAKLAADLVEDTIPASVIAELTLLDALAASSARDEIWTFRDLIDHALSVLRVGGRLDAAPKALEVTVAHAPSRPAEVDRLMETLRSRQRSDNEAKRPSPPPR